MRYLFLAKTVALDGGIQGEKNQNNAKHSSMYDCILEHFAQLTHQFLNYATFFPGMEFPVLFC